MSNGDQEKKKGFWTREEDEILRDHVEKHGEKNWKDVPKHTGLKRSADSCRHRWNYHLKPGVKTKGPLTHDEKTKIISLHDQLGNQYAKIAEQVPGRTSYEIKDFCRSRNDGKRGSPQASQQIQNDTQDVVTMQSPSQLTLSQAFGDDDWDWGACDFSGVYHGEDGGDLSAYLEDDDMGLLACFGDFSSSTETLVHEGFPISPPNASQQIQNDRGDVGELQTTTELNPSQAVDDHAGFMHRDDGGDRSNFSGDNDLEEGKKSAKKKESGWSCVLLDVTPQDNETDMDLLEAVVRSVDMPGLTWGASKQVPVGNGMQKLQIEMNLCEGLVSVNTLIEETLTAEPCNEYIQSCETVPFDKI